MSYKLCRKTLNVQCGSQLMYSNRLLSDKHKVKVHACTCTCTTFLVLVQPHSQASIDVHVHTGAQHNDTSKQTNTETYKQIQN